MRILVDLEAQAEGEAVTAAERFPHEAFSPDDVRVGDVISYPAILRPEHGGRRGDRIVVVGMDSRGLRCVEKVNGEKRESFVVPAQLEGNGVVVEAHVGD